MDEQALVFLKNQQALTTSLKVAKHFGKRHNDVLRTIERCKRDLLNSKEIEKAIVPSTYVDAKGEKRPMYLLDRDGFTFVAMNFTGEKAVQFMWDYIQAFNRMEQILLNQQSEQWRTIRSSSNYSRLSFSLERFLPA